MVSGRIEGRTWRGGGARGQRVGGDEFREGLPQRSQRRRRGHGEGWERVAWIDAGEKKECGVHEGSGSVGMVLGRFTAEVAEVPQRSRRGLGEDLAVRRRTGAFTTEDTEGSREEEGRSEGKEEREGKSGRKEEERKRRERGPRSGRGGPWRGFGGAGARRRIRMVAWLRGGA